MTIKTIALGGAAALALAGAAQAQSFEPKAAGRIMLNLRVTDVAPTADDAITTLAGAQTGLKAKVGDSVMPTIGLTYFFTDHIAAEVIAGTTKHTVKAHGPGTDVNVKDTWVLPPVVALQYHFMPKERFSPYVGAGVNYTVFYSEGGTRTPGVYKVDVDNAFGFALNIGVNIELAPNWLLNFDLKKLWLRPDLSVSTAVGTLGATANLDPWVVGAGVRYRF